MDQFLRYFEDQKFVNWIYNSNPELDGYWKEWIENHPEDKKDIEFARLALIHFRSLKGDGHHEIAELAYSKILQQRKTNPGKSARFFLSNWMKYSAIAIILLSLGIYFTNLLTQKPDFVFDKSFNQTPTSDQSQLILADGRKISLQSKESRIDYESDGKIVINHQDTLQKESSASVTKMNQLVIPSGKSSSVRLSDGSTVYISAGSRFVYPEVFTGKNREVFLVGEGYFEVAHNAKKPFIVRTNDLSIVALGTAFNVSAYPSDKLIETVLVEGKVVLRENAFRILNNDFVVKPNELATFNRETLQTSSREVDVNNYVAWHHGFLNYESADFSRIALQIERFYDIKLVFQNPMIGAKIITGKLVLEEEIDRVLNVLASTAGVQVYQIDANTYGIK